MNIIKILGFYKECNGTSGINALSTIKNKKITCAQQHGLIFRRASNGKLH